MGILTGVFMIIVLSIAGDTIVKIVRARGKREDVAMTEIPRLEAQLREQATALEDTRAVVGRQSEHIDELYERIEFTERLLAQVRERRELPGRPDPV